MYNIHFPYIALICLQEHSINTIGNNWSNWQRKNILEGVDKMLVCFDNYLNPKTETYPNILINKSRNFYCFSFQ